MRLVQWRLSFDNTRLDTSSPVSRLSLRAQASSLPLPLIQSGKEAADCRFQRALASQHRGFVVLAPDRHQWAGA